MQNSASVKYPKTPKSQDSLDTFRAPVSPLSNASWWADAQRHIVERYTGGDVPRVKATGAQTPPDKYAAGFGKIATAALADLSGPRPDLELYKFAGEPVPVRHASSPKSSVRPRSEVICFNESGVLCIDKGDYILFPGGGVDAGDTWAEAH